MAHFYIYANQLINLISYTNSSPNRFVRAQREQKISYIQEQIFYVEKELDRIKLEANSFENIKNQNIQYNEAHMNHNFTGKYDGSTVLRKIEELKNIKLQIAREHDLLRSKKDLLESNLRVEKNNLQRLTD
ncbi:hypothetical protein EDEG_02719 [Edhazardia aedis USNM 41457]|uniref:Uncharacterized protein n=1 Tax=Edhazardia aedis (strain USNM 41457) TaxID=1003232 RepID=J9DJU7_EDHAE|nr:hypothetical protein EDEG_02719 [Edhazardia aedis USNM 41457]|eukprot:EJW02895.1 hypothetical protein EDEG_02719 [Edhazardia aedis USNM 41457]